MKTFPCFSMFSQSRLMLCRYDNDTIVTLTRVQEQQGRLGKITTPRRNSWRLILSFWCWGWYRYWLKTVPHLLRSFIWPVINSDLMSLCVGWSGVGTVVSATGGLNTHRFNRGLRIIIRGDQPKTPAGYWARPCSLPVQRLALLTQIDVDLVDVTYSWWIH